MFRGAIIIERSSGVLIRQISQPIRCMLPHSRRSLRLAIAVPRRGLSSQACAAAAPISPAVIAISTPDENTGSVKAKLSPIMQLFSVQDRRAL